MLDLHYVLQHPDEVAANARNRNVKVDLPALNELAERRRALKMDGDNLRRRANEVASSMKAKMEPERRTALIEEGRALKTTIAKEVEAALEEVLKTIPNLTHPDAPIGATENDNRELRRWGEPRRFDFTPKDHVELGKALDIIDFERGAKVAGANFYFLKGDAVLLELAVTRFAIDILIAEGFYPHLTPDLAHPAILEGIGFNPRGEETQIYSIERQDLALIATAEITLGGMLADETLAEETLPLLLGGLSHCFRTEAGAHGRASRGLYRVHQFTKVEMFAYTTPEQSEAIHQKMLAVEERIFQALEIPYRVVDICTGDLGAPAYRKFDLEAWMPGRGEHGEYGEVTSTSNCTDYQARRLNIRYKPADGGKPRFVHTLNGTAVAISRVLIALLENHQQADGVIRLPRALVPYFGGEIVKGR
jgi:seryl-tRNA synthetase